MRQRRRRDSLGLGLAAILRIKSLVQLPLSISSNEECTADGLIRYNQLEEEEEEEEEDRGVQYM